MTTRRFSFIFLFVLSITFLLAGSARADLLASELSLAAGGEAYEVNADGNGFLWVSDYAASKIWRVDSATGDAVSFTVPGKPSDARFDAAHGNLWWGDATSGLVYRYTPGTDTSLQWTIPGSQGIFGTGIDQAGDLWATDLNYPYLYYQSESQLCKYTIPNSGLSDYLVIDGDFVWMVTWVNPRVLRLQISKGEYLAWELPANSVPSGLVLDFQDRLWWADPVKQEIAYLNPGNNQVHVYTQVPVYAPQMLVAAGSMLWFTDQLSFGRLDPDTAYNTFSEISPATIPAVYTCVENLPAEGPRMRSSPVTEDWTDTTYPVKVDEGGWLAFEMPNGSFTWGNALLDGELWVVDQGRRVLARVPIAVSPAIGAAKTATPTQVPETGADVTFQFEVTNLAGSGSVTLTSLTDSVYGALAGDADCQVGTVLASGASCQFSITRTVAGNATGPYHQDTFIATAMDAENNEATATADARVYFTDVLPSILLTKTASPTHVPESGGDVTFTFKVENQSLEPVTLTLLSDTAFDNLDGKGTCDVPQTIAGSGSYSCTYTKWMESGSLAPHNNTVYAGAQDDEGNPVMEQASATVTFDNVPPQVNANFVADPNHVPETGGDVAFTLTLSNTGAESFIVKKVVDGQDQSLAGKGNCIFPRTIQAGASYACTFTVKLSSDSLTPYVYEVTATTEDEEKSTTMAHASATVTFDNILPTVVALVTANPSSVPENGGKVTFTYHVTNTSSEAVTITSLVDDQFGTLAGTAVCQVGTVLTTGANCQFTLVKTLSGAEGTTHTNNFTVQVEDNDNTTGTASDDAVVTFTSPVYTVYLPMVVK